MLENDDNLKWTKPKFVEICLCFRMEQSKKTEESGFFFHFSWDLQNILCCVVFPTNN